MSTPCKHGVLELKEKVAFPYMMPRNSTNEMSSGTYEQLGEGELLHTHKKHLSSIHENETNPLVHAFGQFIWTFVKPK